MLQRFSMGFRAWDDAGHIINFSLLKPTFRRYAIVKRAVCDQWTNHFIAHYT